MRFELFGDVTVIAVTCKRYLFPIEHHSATSPWSLASLSLPCWSDRLDMRLGLHSLLSPAHEVVRRHTGLAVRATLRLDEASIRGQLLPRHLSVDSAHRRFVGVAPAYSHHTALSIVALHVCSFWLVLELLCCFHRVVLHAFFE